MTDMSGLSTKSFVFMTKPDLNLYALDENNKVIMKFHSEPHNDKRYQTSTEPFHIHGNENSKLTNEKRFPNYNFKSLWDIMEFLRLMIIYFDEMPHY